MSTRSEFRLSLETVEDFDGEDALSSSSSGHDDHGTDATEMLDLPEEPLMPNQLLLVALLEQMCSLYITDPKKSSKLFKVLCRQLSKMKVMNPLGPLDELSSIRTQYKHSFYKLFKAAIENLNLDMPLALTAPGQEPSHMFMPKRLPRQHPVISLSDVISHHTSRYRDEFKEVCTLGRGAYGSVYKVYHKLDHVCYAIKKVAFQDNSPELWFKTLREVKCLADISHPGVIRYFTAWLEYQLPWLLPSGDRTVPLDDEVDESEMLVFDSVTNGGALVSYNRYLGVSSAGRSTGSSIVFAQPDVGDSSPWRSHHVAGGYGDVDDEDELSFTGAEAGSFPNDLIQKACVVLHIQMELCSQTLKEWMNDRNSTLTTSEDPYAVVDEVTTLGIVKELLEAVAYLHGLNLLHRDIKPKNVFLLPSDDGTFSVKIGDFGLARQGKGPGSPTSPMTPGPGLMPDLHLESGEQLTSGVGTTIYAAPEQLSGTFYCSKSDMYSLGLMVFELYQPFRTEMERTMTLSQVRKSELPAAFSMRWPQKAALVERLTRLVPSERPSAKDILEGDLFFHRTPVEQEPEGLQSLVNRQRDRIELLERQLLERDQLIAELRHRLSKDDSDQRMETA